MKKNLLLLITLLIGSPTLMQSQTLLNDTFSDGERATQSLPSSASWYTSYSAGSLAVSGGQLAQTVNLVSGNITLGYFTGSGSPQTLNVGDSLSLSAKITFVGLATTSTIPAFRFALLNSGGTRIVADNKGNLPATHEYQNDTGYSVFFTNPAGSNSGYIGARTNLASDNLYATGNFTNLAGTSTLSALSDSTAYQMSLVVTKTSTSLMTITATVQDASTSASMFSFTTTDSTYLYSSFDEIAFFALGNGTNQVATTVDFDDINVTYASAAVPEVKSGYLILGGILLIFAFRKKKLI
ncbi:MAG: hypothetical protein V4507_06685 [Verrucomicrobiota bacterium]